MSDEIVVELKELVAPEIALPDNASFASDLEAFIYQYKQISADIKVLDDIKKDMREEWGDRIMAFGAFECQAGKIRIKTESSRSNWDSKKLDNLLAELAKTHPATASRLAGCRETKPVKATWDVL